MEDPFQFVQEVRKVINAAKPEEQKEIRKVSLLIVIVLGTHSVFHCSQIKAKLKRFANDEERILLLTRLWHVLSPTVIVNCHKFIQYGFLYGPVCGISSDDAHVRSIAYSVLQRFYCHLESGQDFVGRLFWTGFIDNIRCMMKTTNEQLPTIVTSFLAYSIEILIEPSHPLLESLRNAVIDFRKPSDIWKCLKKLLHASDPQSQSIQINWSLKVIFDSCSSGSKKNFDELFNHQIIDTLIQNLISCSTPTDTKILCAEIMECATRNEIVARKLCIDHSIHSFMLILAIDYSSKTSRTASKQLIDLVSMISKNTRTSLETEKNCKVKKEERDETSSRIMSSVGQEPEINSASRKRKSNEIDGSKSRQDKDVPAHVIKFFDHALTILDCRTEKKSQKT